MVTRYTPVAVGVYSDTGIETFPVAENFPWAFTVGPAKDNPHDNKTKNATFLKLGLLTEI
jgi:hypothetical protein